jgi:hypothetical protein
MTWVCALLLLGQALLANSATPGVAAPVYAPKPLDLKAAPVLDGRVDLRQQVEVLEKWRLSEHQRLQASGRATAANFKAVDDAYLSASRKAEANRTQALSKLNEHAGIEIKQGAGGTQPAQGRGLAGDIDTESLSAKDFQRVKQTAEKMGYDIVHQGDSMTIKELNVTVHRQSARDAGMGSQVGSSAHQTEAGRGLNEETALGYKAQNPSASVSDNLKKAAHTLDTPAGKLSLDDMQKMGKMTGRNLAEMGQLKPASTQAFESLQQQSKMLKEGYSPEAAGIVRDGATPDQRAQDLADFQKRARQASVESVKTTETWADTQTTELSQSAKRAEDTLERLKGSGDAQAIRQAQQAVELEKTKLIDFKATQSAAKQAAVLNPTNGTQASSVMAEAKGIATNGKPPSVVREEILLPDRKIVVKTVNTAPIDGAKVSVPTEPATVAPGRSSQFMKGLKGIMDIYNIYNGVKEGAAQAGEESVKNGDSTATSVLKAAGYSVWHGLGFGGAQQAGAAAGEASAQQWAQDVKDGKIDPNSKLSQAWAHIRGVGWGLADMTGLTGIKNAAVEGVGMMTDASAQTQAEKAVAEQQKELDAKRAALAAAGLPSVAQRAAQDQLAKDKALTDKAEQDKAERERARRIQAEKEKERVDAERVALEKSNKDKAEADKVAAAKVEADKAAAAQLAKVPALPPGAHEELGGWVKDKNGTTKLTYIKDAAGHVLGGYNTHYDLNGKEVSREDFKSSPLPVNAPMSANAVEGSYSGRFSGQASGSLRFTLKAGHVSGSLSGSSQGDGVNASFTGTVDAKGHLLAHASGVLRGRLSPEAKMESWPFAGTLTGNVGAGGGSGSWSAEGSGQKTRGSWNAAK